MAFSHIAVGQVCTRAAAPERQGWTSMVEDPHVASKKLRTQLKQYRLACSRTQKQVAEALFWSLSKVIRIESGAVRVSVTDCRALLDLYDVTGSPYDDAIALAQAARQPSDLAMYASLVAPEARLLMAQEVKSTVITSFQPHVVPGHLQTPEYTREVLTYIRGSKDPARVNGMVDLRTQRQSRLFQAQPSPPRMRFMLDESVIRRQVGGPDVMRPQMRRLLDLATRPFIDLRVVPFRLGMYRSLRVPYVVLEFEDPAEEDLLYLEHAEGERIVRSSDVDMTDEIGAKSPTAPSTYLEIYTELEDLTSDEETSALIHDAMQALDRDTSSAEPPGED